VNVEPLVAEVERELRRRPAAAWLEAFEAAGVPCGPVNTVAEAVCNPQVAPRNMVLEIADPTIGALYVAGNPVKMSGVPEPASHRPPPDLDADRGAILDWLITRPRGQ